MTPSFPPETIPGRIEQATLRNGTITFLGADRTSEQVSWAQLHEEARAVAASLQARGVCPGDHVTILGSTSRCLVTAIQATWLAGAATVVLPLPLRMGSVDEFVSQTRARIQNADSRLTLIDSDLSPYMDGRPGDPPVVALDDLGARGGGSTESHFEVPEIDPGSVAILQFTSGSTADPKGVMLAHRQVTANVDSIVQAARLDLEYDRIVSWLPLYHDMGLIGLMGVPMLNGVQLALGAPQDFMAAPDRWMEWMSEQRATATGGPNFAYTLAARGLARQRGLDLSRWRIALNGAEPIDPDAVEAFCAAARPHGFDPDAVFCVYGMAEATLAISFPEPGEGMATDCVDRWVLEQEACALPVEPGDRRGRRLARLGRPIPGLEVRVVDTDDRRPVLEREVGEIEIRGNSLMTGYYKRPDATAEVFWDGWLRTGDLGYQVDGELVVCGRSKDMIIVGGRNIFPEDVERAVASVQGVRPGNVIAFGVQGRKGREALVVVAETREEDHAPIRKAVGQTVRHKVGLPLEELVLVTPGSLPKTSSGKLQRSLCRSRYLNAKLEPV